MGFSGYFNWQFLRSILFSDQTNIVPGYSLYRRQSALLSIGGETFIPEGHKLCALRNMDIHVLIIYH